MTVEGSAQSGLHNIPIGLASAVDRLDRLFEDLHVDDGVSRASWDFPDAPPNRYRVLTIAGPRGAGKTTLLDIFAKRLVDRPDTAVLPPLQPEMFSAVDTVFSVVLTRLRALITRNCEAGTMARVEVPVPTLGANYNLAQALDSLLRSSAFLHDRSAAIEQNAPSLNQYSSDFVTQALAGEEFTVLWDATLKTCAETLSARPGVASTIVVPIDDPDLAPELLPSILRDIRVVAKTPHVMVCVCLDLNETRSVLSADYVKALGLNLIPESAYAIVEAQLSKALPAPLRVTLGDLSQAQRLDFTPLHYEHPPLDELLSSLEIPTQAGRLRVGDLFWLPADDGGRGKPSPYADCLPAIPRDLEQLHHAVYGVVSAVSEGDATAGLVDVVETLVESAVRNGFRRTTEPQLKVDQLVSVEPPATEGELPRLLIDFSQLAYVREGRTDSLRMRSDLDRPEFAVELGPLGALRASVRGADDESEQQQHVLHPSLTLGVLLGREFVDYGELFVGEITGSEPISGGKTNDLLNLREGSVPADRFFLVLPRWRTFYDYFVFDAVWRSALGRAGDLTSGFDVDPPGIVPGLVIFYARVVAEIQTTRSARFTPEEFEEFCTGAPESVLLAAWERATEAISNAVDGPDNARVRAFQSWLANYLPMACHPWLLPDWLIEAILSERARWMERFGGSNVELRYTLHQRIRANLGDNWVTPIFDAFRGMPDLQLESLRAKQAQSVQQREHELLTLEPTPAVAQLRSPDLAREAVRVLEEMLHEVEQRGSGE